MLDTIQINTNTITSNLSVIIEEKESLICIGYVPAFGIPFTSPNKEKASEIAKGLINSLLRKWMLMGDIKLFKLKLSEYGFIQRNNIFEKDIIDTNTFQIKTDIKNSLLEFITSGAKRKIKNTNTGTFIPNIPIKTSNEKIIISTNFSVSFFKRK